MLLVLSLANRLGGSPAVENVENQTTRHFRRPIPAVLLLGEADEAVAGNNRRPEGTRRSTAVRR